MVSSRVRRILVAALIAEALVRAGAQQPAPRDATQPPVFRGGTTLVQVDAIVSDSNGRPIIDLTADDFEVTDDGRPVPLQRVRFLGAEVHSGDAAIAPIRNHDDEEREASRDD